MLSAAVPLFLHFQLDPAALGAWGVPAIGLVATGLAFAVGVAVLNRRPGRARRSRAQGGPNAAQSQTDLDPFLQGSSSERRIAARRVGNMVCVLVTDGDAQTAPVEGWVADRSVGGLCLRLDAPIGVGSTLNVRPRDASSVVPWTPVEVRSCRQEADGWDIGCQFVRTPPWSVLLLFG
jgi:hypothetical protein